MRQQIEEIIERFIKPLLPNWIESAMLTFMSCTELLTKNATKKLLESAPEDKF